MAWIITTILVWSVFKAALCFNIDPVAWKSLTNNGTGFGYQVVQRPSDLLVSDPLEQFSGTQRGKIFKCTTTCQRLQVYEPQFAVNMSLGLSMASDPTSQKTMACGPTIPKDCRSITLYNGICVEIDANDKSQSSVPASIGECQTQDIAFLLDGSGSVNRQDFVRMKTFVKNMISSFLGKGTHFAIVQFSSATQVHYYFSDFTRINWQNGIDKIYQTQGGTRTAAAIRTVVSEVFQRGSRPNAKKVLLVVTDGESQDSDYLKGAINLAETHKIVRFAVGVGRAFTNDQAEQELRIIASDPSDEHVFRVDNFEALEKIRENLQDKIFSIEGSQSSGETLKMEMSQEGFSAAYVPGGVQLAIVGANQWRGGYKRYTGGSPVSYESMSMEPDSYLGYSMAIAKTKSGTLTVVGAPRYKHRGAVEVVFLENPMKRIEPYISQTGQYFGAEVCAMDVNLDSYTDLILISAPMYKDIDREGQVYVCTVTGLTVDCHFDLQSPSTVLKGDASDKGRFGSSLAVLPDLNSDRLNDLAIGAPLENDGQGSIYIFLGEGGRRISSTYSQRIAASQVSSGLKFFGWSISQWSFDQSNDNLPDLAVGSKGTVVLLRSRPVVMVEADVSFIPNEIPTQNVDCSKPLESTAKICFTMTRRSTVNTAQAQINYTLTLDATRNLPKNRAYINEKQRHHTGSVNVNLNGQTCNNVKFLIESCPEDALNKLVNELRFTFEGLPSSTNLRPSLSQQAETTTFHSIEFEINCGADEKCVDNLKVDFNYSSSEVKVGIDEFLDVKVSVENREENSYNSLVSLTYPVGLSYRTFTVQQGRIECSSLDSENGITLGKTDCTIDKPIFKSNSKVLFVVSYRIAPHSQLDRRIFVSANATSGNQHSPSSELYMRKEIDVKYSIYMTIESSLRYINFTFGQTVQKPLQQAIKVTNNVRELNFTVVIRVPVKLGDKDIWADLNSLQIPGCKSGEVENPNVTDFVARIQEKKAVDCSVASCRVFRCSRFMGKLESTTYTIAANLSSGWIEQIGLQSAKFLLTSTASLEYDKNKYIFFSIASNNNPPVRKIVAEVEVYTEPDFTKEIVGGTLGGLAFLALLTAGLYKAGFFKSKYSEMMNENGEAAADPGTEGDAPLQE